MTRWGWRTALALGVAAPAGAQIAPGPAVQVPAQQRSQAELSRPQVDPVAPPDAPRPRARLVVSNALAPGPCPLRDSPVRVTLASVRFENGRGGELPPVLTRVLAPVTIADPGEQPVASVCEIRDRAAAALNRAGYVAAVQIPSQEIAGGTLRLSIVAARIVEVRVEGVNGALHGDLSRRIEQIRALDPLNQRDAERLLLLANDVPGLTLQLPLQPAGKEPGDVIAVVSVDQTPGVLIANYQNTGSRQLGPSLFSLRGELYGLTGHADQTYLGFSNSSQWHEVHVVQAGHSMDLGGVRMGLRGSFAKSNPTIPNLDLRSRSVVAGFDLSTPLFRGLDRTGSTLDDLNVYVGTGLELLTQRTIVRGNGTDVPFARDRLRVAYARLGSRVTSRDAYGVPIHDIDLLVELRRGLNIFNATQRGVTEEGFQPSRLAGDPRAFEIRATVNQTIRPFRRADQFGFDISAYGQWANRPLLNLEEFTVGNLTYGRGYDPGANAGDRAVAIRFSPRWRVAQDDRSVWELTGFYDAVRFWNLDPGTLDTNRLLRSFGGGVRLSLRGRMSIDLSYAKPIDRVLTTDIRRPRDRLLLSITTQILPWRFGR